MNKNIKDLMNYYQEIIKKAEPLRSFYDNLKKYVDEKIKELNTLKGIKLTSELKTQVQIQGRKEAIKTLQSILNEIKSIIVEADIAQQELDKIKNLKDYN